MATHAVSSTRRILPVARILPVTHTRSRFLAALLGIVVLVGLSGCGATTLQKELNWHKDQRRHLLQDRDELQSRLAVAKGEQEALKERVAHLTEENQQLREQKAMLSAELVPVSGEEGEPRPAVEPGGPTGFEGMAGVTSERSEGAIRVTLTEVLFPSGQADLNTKGRARVDEIAAVLRRDYAGRSIVVEGHTDSTPIKKVKARFPTNWELSSARASAVLRALVSRKAVSPANASVIGFGSSRPRGDNGTEEGRKLNRRVEIVVE